MARKIDESLQFPQPLGGTPQAQTLPPGQIPKKMGPQLRWPNPMAAPDPAAAAAPPAAPPTAAPPAAAPPAAAPAVPPEVKSGGWFKRTVGSVGNAATAVGGAAKTVGGLAAGAAGAAVPSMAGYGAAGALNTLRQKELDSAPAFVAPETQPGQIPGAAPGQVAPRAEAGSFLNQSEAGRNFGNAVMAIPGGSGAMRAVQSALRVAPVVGRTAQAASIAERALPVSRALEQGFVGGDIANPGKSALPPASAPAAPFSDARQGPAVPTPAFVQKEGTILRDGNSYSGKNVQVDADIVNKDGSLRKPGGGYLSTGSSEGFRQDQLELQRNAAERAAMPVGGATDMGGRTTMMDDLVAKSKAGGPDLSKLPAGRRARLETGLRQSQEANANAMAIAGMNNSTAQAGLANSANIAAMHDATQRRSNDQNNATSLRAQDMSLAGHMAPLQYQQARMQLAGKYMQAANGDPAKAQTLAMSDGAHDVADHFSKNVNALQGQASSTQKIAKEQHEGARALFNGRGTSLIDPSLTGDAKASALKAAEDEAHNFAVQTVPGWNQMPIEQREKLMPKVLGLHELHQKTKNPDHAGNLAWARSLTGSQDNAEPATGLREQGFYKGGQIGSRYGVVSGALTKDYEAGDVDFTPGGGKNSLRIAKPSAEALAALRRLTQGKDPLAD